MFTELRLFLALPNGCVLVLSWAVFAGERRWVVSDIIGAEDGLGVENLSGSAAIGTLYCK